MIVVIRVHLQPASLVATFGQQLCVQYCADVQEWLPTVAHRLWHHKDLYSEEYADDKDDDDDAADTSGASNSNEPLPKRTRHSSNNSSIDDFEEAVNTP